MLEIINDILDISKVEAGKLELAAIEVDLRHILQTAVKTLACRAGEKRLKLRWGIDPDVPRRVVGDPHRLRQVLINLVGNAVKFTDQGRITVNVQLEEEGSRLHFIVADTGIGIPEDQYAVIFEPFLQVDGSASRRFGGTGLGLAICKRFVEMMGGHIWVESRLGCGSRFHFTIRLVRGAPAATAAANIPACQSEFFEAPVSDSKPPLRLLSILLAEDNPVNQKLAVRLLQKRGHTVVVATTGVEAVSAYKKQAFDVVLMDIQMPEMDGFEATARIRNHEGRTGARTPIIALTAHAMRGDCERCLKAGMDAYLEKPIQAARMFDLLDRTFQTHGESAPALQKPGLVSPAAVGPAPVSPAPAAGDAERFPGLRISTG